MRRSGFTMVEVLLVTAIFAGLGLAVFTCLSNGLKLWARTQQLQVDEDAAVFLDRFSSEIKNTFFFSELLLEGEELRIAFPTVVLTQADRAGSRAKEEMIDQLGRIRYSYDSGEGVILREQANYSQGTRGEFSSPRVEVRGVRSLRFRYYYAGVKDPLMTTKEGEQMPSGVEVEILFSDNGQERVLRRYVPIPVGA